jgi:GT2 family glycosyltransferase
MDDRTRGERASPLVGGRKRDWWKRLRDRALWRERRTDSPDSTSYARWIALHDRLTDDDRALIRAHIVRLANQPLISVVMPVYDAAEPILREAINSVRRQLYRNWELCICDDASPSPHVPRVLAKLAAADSRIKWVRREANGHISAASNTALTLTEGEFVALMDHDDVLAEQALYEMAVELDAHPDADLVYSDEDGLSADGVRRSPYFKTDWNPELMLGQNMINHLALYRRSLVESVGGFRVGFEGSQDYDLALRVIARTTRDKIRHVPAVLYHWREGGATASYSTTQLGQCLAAALNARSEHLTARGEAAEIEPSPLAPEWARVRRPIPTPAPLVSLIVPTRDRHDLLGPCMDGLLRRTTYPALEVILIDHENVEPESLALIDRFRGDPRVQVLRYEGPFNYSDMNNRAAAQARGELIGLVNNDVDVITPDWLSEMVSLAVKPEYGAIGAKLLYPDGRVQHAGTLLGVGGLAHHVGVRASRDEAGYFGRLALTTNVSAVTAACLVVRKEVFDEVGGLNAIDLPVNFNDVDFCLKVAARGYLNVFTPFAQLYHHESPSRGEDETPEKSARAQGEREYMQRAWGEALLRDPFYNPNLTLDADDFGLAFPPRRAKPWKVAPS